MQAAQIKSLEVDLALFKRGFEQLASLQGLEEWKRESLAESSQKIELLRAALVYHQAQTRPIANTEEVLEATKGD